MKLNLLPQTASKGRQLKSAWFLMALMIILSAVAAAFLIIAPKQALDSATQEAQNNEQSAADAVATSQQADTVIAQAADLIRNANLAQALIDHNDVYPKLYSDLRPYIPGFFRLTSEVAQPVDAQTCTVTLQGTILTYQQYAELMIELMRFPGATSVSRSNFNFDEEQVPAVSPDDPSATPKKLEDPAVPKDQLQRLAYLQSRTQPRGYLGAGNFGSGTKDVRLNTPKESLITVVLTVSRDLRVPSAESTLTGSGGGAAAGGFGGGAPGGGGLGGPLGGGGGALGAAAAAGAGGAAGAKNNGGGD